MTFYSFDTPVGDLMVAPCLHPESNAERPDVPIGMQCPEHNRTAYLCLDNSVLWCDGYCGDNKYTPHELDLTVGKVIGDPDPRESACLYPDCGGDRQRPCLPSCLPDAPPAEGSST